MKKNIKRFSMFFMVFVLLFIPLMGVLAVPLSIEDENSGSGASTGSSTITDTSIVCYKYVGTYSSASSSLPGLSIGLPGLSIGQSNITDIFIFKVGDRFYKKEANNYELYNMVTMKSSPNSTISSIPDGSRMFSTPVSVSSDRDCPENSILRVLNTLYSVTDNSGTKQNLNYSAPSTSGGTIFDQSSSSSSGSSSSDSDKSTAEMDYETSFGNSGRVDSNASTSTSGADLGAECFIKEGDSLYNWLQIIFTVIRIGVPILVVLLVMIDLVRAVLSGDDKNMKEAQSTAVKRVAIGFAIFLVPSLVNLVFNILNGFSGLCGIGW